MNNIYLINEHMSDCWCKMLDLFFIIGIKISQLESNLKIFQDLYCWINLSDEMIKNKQGGFSLYFSLGVKFKRTPFSELYLMNPQTHDFSQSPD